MAGVVGLQQLLRMQGLEWGDSSGNDVHLWFEGGTIKWDGIITPTYNVPLGSATTGSLQLWTTQMPQLAAQFGSGADAFRAWDFDLISDTTSSGYGGIMNAMIVHLDVYSVGATWAKIEVIAGVFNTKSSATGTISDGYCTSGECIHAGTSTITKLSGLLGTIGIFAAGNAGSVYGTDSNVFTTLGQTGTVTVKAVGARAYVQVNNVNAMNLAIGAENFVDLVAATTITTDVYGAFNYLLNSGAATATVSGNAYASYDKIAYTGAQVFSGVVYATFSQFLMGGSGVGGTTNAALNAEIQWNSTSIPTGNIYAAQLRNRVSQNVVVGTSECLHILSPVFANSGTFNLHRAIHILNQGSSSITTSTAILIDAQSGSGTNDALNILGGNIKFAVPFTSYNNISLGGNGIPSEVKVTRPATQTNTTVTLATYTTPAADGSYEIQANLNVTVSTTVTMTVTCSYTDEANVARVLTLPFFLLAGTLVQSITTAQGNIPYSSMPITIRTKASTSITIATAGTVTAVTYTGEGIIKQLA